MKKLYPHSLIITAFSLLFMSCENVDFGDINLNPNEPSTASTPGLLTSSIRSIPSIVSEVNSNLMVQHLSEITYTEDSRYEQFEWSYDSWYSGPLKNLQEIIDLNTDDPNRYLDGGTTANQIAVARILKVFYFQYLTNRWGAVPYREALQGTENIKPVFDQQESIYLGDGGLFNELDSALAQMELDGTLQGDILFNGDLTQWRKFANTLKMIMAIRIADRDAARAQAAFNEAHSGGVLGSTAENMHYPYLSENNNDNPWQDRFETREDFAISDVFVDFLTESNDPRLSEFAEPAANTGNFVGCPYGVANPNVLQAEISFITSEVIYDGTTKGGMIFSYAQICFSYAEAAARGWNVPDTAAIWYERGIDASMEQWGVATDAAASYKAQASVAFDSSNWKASIGTQKWIALYLQGSEAWVEWRRLDYPHLTPAVDALSGNGIPVRNGYAALTKTLNEENYNAAVSAQGPDNQDTKLWWDTN